MRDAMRIQRRLNFPVIIRASRTLGGSGGNFAFGPEDFKEVVEAGLSISPVHEVLIEESVLGWKEFELEVMRDHKDNVVITHRVAPSQCRESDVAGRIDSKRGIGRITYSQEIVGP